MGILGKLLLVGNLFLGAGLVYLIGQDWAIRQGVQATALRQQLMITGMPVVAPPGITGGDDAIPIGVVASGQMVVDTVSKKFLDDHFAGTTGEELGGTGPARTQMDEVKAVRGKLAGKLGAPREQLTLLCGSFTPAGAGRVTFAPGLLTNMAESADERDLLRAMVAADALADPQRVEENAKTARAMLDRRFDALDKVDAQAADAEAAQVKGAADAIKKSSDAAQDKFRVFSELTKPGNTSEAAAIEAAAKEANDAIDKLSEAHKSLAAVLAGQGKAASRDDGDRRRRIGHLLVHLNETPGWQKRVALVVGLETYLKVVGDQTARFQRMGATARQSIIHDQARFTEEYDLLRQLAISRSLQLRNQVAVRTEFERQRSSAEAAAKDRLAFLGMRRTELAKLQQEVSAALAAQTEVEQRLFTAQKQVGEAMQKNFELEDRLRAAETKGR